MGSIISRVERLEKKRGGDSVNKCPCCAELPALKIVYTINGELMPEFEDLPPTICPACGKPWRERIVTIDFDHNPSDESYDGKPMSYEQIMQAADQRKDQKQRNAENML